MSFDSGRRLGLTASIINIIAPIASIVLAVALLFEIFASISGAIYSGGRPTATPILSSFLIIGVIAIIAIVAFIALILFLISMHKLGSYYYEQGIFRNALYGFIINIVGVIISLAVSAFFTLALRGSAGVSAPSTSPFAFTAFGTFIAVGVVGFVFAIVSGIFYMRAFHLLAQKSGISSFSTAGTLYLIGVVLQIVLIGALLIWIAWIFSAIGFNSLKPKSDEKTPLYSTPNTPPTYSLSQEVDCRQCGAQNSANSMYCWSCGKPLPKDIQNL